MLKFVILRNQFTSADSVIRAFYIFLSFFFFDLTILRNLKKSIMIEPLLELTLDETLSHTVSSENIESFTLKSLSAGCQWADNDRIACVSASLASNPRKRDRGVFFSPSSSSSNESRVNGPKLVVLSANCFLSRIPRDRRNRTGNKDDLRWRGAARRPICIQLSRNRRNERRTRNVFIPGADFPHDLPLSRSPFELRRRRLLALMGRNNKQTIISKTWSCLNFRSIIFRLDSRFLLDISNKKVAIGGVWC